MQNMQAIVMPRRGPADVLQPIDLAIPEITAPDQVRIQLKAAGVNPIDTKLRRNGTFFPDRLPAVLGCDGAGMVDAVGDAVTRFKPGDAVYFCYGGVGDQAGNYAQFTVVPENRLAAKPASLDFNQAAAAPLVLLTAWEALHDRARMSAGQRILIHAGAGGVGHVAIQLATIAGARVATTVRSHDKATFAAGLGAELPIRYRDTDFVSEVNRWTDGHGVDIAMDNVGGNVLQQTFPAVKFYGDIVTLLLPDQNTDWGIARQRNLRISLEVMLTPMLFDLPQAQQHQATILETCAGLFDAGQLRVHISDTLPLREAARAHEMIEIGSTRGKIVLQIDD